jgi:HPt (histidine-containing phosphotransfer) domain-containing protein
MQEPSSSTTVVRVEANIVKVVKKFIQRCLQTTIPELHKLAAEQNYVQLAKEAHNIKGTGGLMSVSALIALGEQLELAAKAGNAEQVQRRLNELSRFLQSITVVAG